MSMNTEMHTYICSTHGSIAHCRNHSMTGAGGNKMEQPHRVVWPLIGRPMACGLGKGLV